MAAVTDSSIPTRVINAQRDSARQYTNPLNGPSGNVFSECITRAPTLIINNPNYVKKVVFPLEILDIIFYDAIFYPISALPERIRWVLYLKIH